LGLNLLLKHLLETQKKIVKVKVNNLKQEMFVKGRQMGKESP